MLQLNYTRTIYDDLKYIEVLKLHGDIKSSDIVITKTDYEDFNLNHKISISRLENDLISKSFLFIGYSYKDSNIQNIVNSVRQLLDGKYSKKHYMILEQPKNLNDQKMQTLWIRDIERHGIYVYEYENGKYSELEKILQIISRKSKGRSVFVTGGHMTENDNLAEIFGEALFDIDGLILKYGHSKGIGNIVCNKYAQKCVSKKLNLEDRVEIFANPYSFCSDWDNQDFLLGYLERFRRKLIQNVQIIIAFPGGKGTLLEIKMALKMGAVIIPVFESNDDFKSEIIGCKEIIRDLEVYDSGYVKKILSNSVSAEDILNCVKVVLGEKL